MTAAWLVLSLLAPAAVTVVASLLRPPKPPAPVVLAAGALVPGAGLVLARRSMLEVVLGVLLAQVSLVVVGGPGDIGMYVPIMVIGAAWCSLYTRLSPVKALETLSPPVDEEARLARASATSTPTPMVSTVVGSQDEDEGPAADSGYSVAVRCTECGADIEVSVLQHMAHCQFCGSQHVVVGHDEVLHLALPEKVADPMALREAVLDHYRYVRYLELYKRHVAPLERQATGATPEGAIVESPEMRAAAAAAEARVARRADDYRARLAAELRIGAALHFLAPYRHGMGTLYEAAFGRSRHDQEKQLVFAIGTVEASAAGCRRVELPAMGRLSYLRALYPAGRFAGTLRTLPLEAEPEALEHAYGNLDKKQIDRSLQVIRLGTAFVPEVTAVVWRPWWTVGVETHEIHETLLVDAAAGSVTGYAPALDQSTLEEVPTEGGGSLRFVPMQCPTCGFEFPFDHDAVLHFCRNCHRVFGVRGGTKVEMPYERGDAEAGGDVDLLPFWRFPLRLRTGDGRLVTDLPHFTDGIDGALDQIGDAAPVRQDFVLVPAIRLINSRLMTRTFNRLFLHTASRSDRFRDDRFPLDAEVTPLTVSLAEPEARRLAPLYLANSFSRRDLARVNVHQVGSWLFESRLEAEGRLAYLPVPRAITEPFRRYIGRFRGAAIDNVTR